MKSLTVAGTDRQFGPAQISSYLARSTRAEPGGLQMNGVIYLVGLVVVVQAILSLFGLR
jgi:hypothetical protein